MFEITTKDFILGCLFYTFIHWLAVEGVYQAYKDMKKAQANRQKQDFIIVDGKEVDPKNVTGFPEIAFKCEVFLAVVLETIMLPCTVMYIYTFVTQ